MLRTISGSMVNPEALAFDSSGNLYVGNVNGGPLQGSVTVYASGSDSLPPNDLPGRGLAGCAGL